MKYRKRIGAGVNAAKYLYSRYLARRKIKKPNRTSRKVRFRLRGGSKTTTRPKLKGSTDNDQHSGLGVRRIVLTLNKPLKGKGIAHWKFAQNYANILTGNAGNQVSTIVCGVGQKNQFLTATAIPNVLQTRVSLFDLNNDRIVAGSGLFASQSPATDRIALYKVRTQFLFTNLESIASTLYLYYVTPKKDCNRYIDLLWSDSLTKEALGVATRTRAGAGGYGGTTSGAALSTDVFQKPFDCAEVHQYYKCLKVMKINLAAGASEEVVLTTNINKIVSLARLNDTAATTDSLRGLSLQVLAVAYSQPVHDQTLGGTNCTTGSVRIGMVATSTFHCGLTAASASARADDMLTNQQMADNVTVANQVTIDINDAVAGVDQA